MHSTFDEREVSIETCDVLSSRWSRLPFVKDCAFLWLQLHLCVAMRDGKGDRSQQMERSVKVYSSFTFPQRFSVNYCFTQAQTFPIRDVPKESRPDIAFRWTLLKSLCIPTATCVTNTCIWRRWKDGSHLPHSRRRGHSPVVTALPAYIIHLYHVLDQSVANQVHIVESIPRQQSTEYIIQPAL